LGTQNRSAWSSPFPLLKIGSGFVARWLQGFHGETNLYLEADDFDSLLPDLRQLYESLRGNAEFKTIENQVGFRLTGDGRGHIELRGHLLDRFGDGNRLDFTLNYDQTLLWHSIAEIDNLLTAIAGSKDA
jgi:hypothetical protein